MTSLVTEPAPESAGQRLTMGQVSRADLASGRPLTYEWEFFVDDLYSELASAGIGPQTFEFDQVPPAAVWTINHALTAFPTVLIVAADGQELHAEVHYPDDQTVVVIHGAPYSGTAYLRI